MGRLEILCLSSAYMALLFAVAWRSERRARAGRARGGALVYGLSLAVYCTSWTFFGAVGTAARSGWDYLPIYIGPTLAITLLFPIWRRIAFAAKRENTGSIADFLSARYGKSRAVGAVVAGVAILGALPYIALQLRSLTMAVGLLSRPDLGNVAITFILGAVLAGFAMLFGARRVDLTEHNPGLMRAVAVETVVKIGALLTVAGFALLLVLKGHPPHLPIAPRLERTPPFDLGYVTKIVLAAAAAFCLPRQFHVAFVELERPADMAPARWMFPIYLTLTCLAVVPLASAGLRLQGPLLSNPDLFVLAIPFSAGFGGLTALVYIGGFSAATAMVVVETVALSAMASNQLILPWLTRGWEGGRGPWGIPATIIGVRQAAIGGVLFVACLYACAVNTQENLASIGLLSFAAFAQLAPALAGAVLWRRAHSSGALAGVAIGFAGWILLLATPQLLGPTNGYSLAISTSFARLGVDTLTGGALVSLGGNVAAFIGLSLRAKTRAVDHIQARAFVSPAAGVAEARVGFGDEIGALHALVARFLGEAGAARGFAEAARELGRRFPANGQVDAPLALAAERMLAGAIGASSARGVIAEALAGDARRPRDVMRMLDNAAQAVQFNRELLQSTLDNLAQGVSVVDADLRLVAWNQRYLHMFDLPPDFVHVGKPIADVIRFNALRGECGPGEIDALVERRLEHLRKRRPHRSERVRLNGDIISSTGAPTPNGGYLTSYTDISELRTALSELARSHDDLELRVMERTEALAEAKAEAETATASKTRFLAAASHDLLQPLHAARLFLSALGSEVGDAPELKDLVHSADQSLESAHRLLRALLNLSKLEAGGVKPQRAVFPIGPVFQELARDFAARAAAKGLSLRFFGGGGWVDSDRDLVRSVLQNLLSNAIRYSETGGVLVALRTTGAAPRLQVWDTGPGIAEPDREAVFQPFTRLGVRRRDCEDDGAGLGLAIVAKVVQLLGETIRMESVVGRGTCFTVTVGRADPGTLTAAAPLRSASVRSGLRVLCVDNEPTILKGLQAALERMGASVVTARDQSEALATEGHFDLALIDYHLDEGDGLSLCRSLGVRVERFAVVTADSSEEVVVKAAAAGAEFVQKPCRPDTLQQLLSLA